MSAVQIQVFRSVLAPSLFNLGTLVEPEPNASVRLVPRPLLGDAFWPYDAIASTHQLLFNTLWDLL